MNLVDLLILPAMRDRGLMTNSEIYRSVHRRARRSGLHLTAHWRATVRNTLQRHAMGNPKCGKRPLFLHVGRATWKLRSRIR
jgi:hypothetical protein